MEIVIVGPSCTECKKVEQVVKNAIAQLAAGQVTFRKVTDLDEIMQYPILILPTLVINCQVVCSGRVPTKAEVMRWITTALEGKA